MFEPGQEVVCIRDDWIGRGERGPRKGLIYTVEGVHFAEAGRIIYTANGVAFKLKADMVFISLRGFRYYYAAKYFKPVRKTDISIFTAMLDKVPA